MCCVPSYVDDEQHFVDFLERQQIHMLINYLYSIEDKLSNLRYDDAAFLSDWAYCIRAIQMRKDLLNQKYIIDLNKLYEYVGDLNNMIDMYADFARHYEHPLLNEEASEIADNILTQVNDILKFIKDDGFYNIDKPSEF